MLFYFSQMYSMIFYKMIAAFPVFLIQPGSARAESDFTRVKNTANIMMNTLVNRSLERLCVGLGSALSRWEGGGYVVLLMDGIVTMER